MLLKVLAATALCFASSFISAMDSASPNSLQRDSSGQARSHSQEKKEKWNLSSSQEKAKLLRIAIPTHYSDSESAEESPSSTDRRKNSPSSPFRLAPASPLARVKGFITQRSNSRGNLSSRGTHSSFSGDSDEATNLEAASLNALDKQKHQDCVDAFHKALKKLPAKPITNKDLIDYFGEDFWEGQLPTDSSHENNKQSKEDSESL